MAAGGGRRVMVTIPEDAPPGTVISIPVKDCDPVQIRVPNGLGPGSKVKLTRLAHNTDWDVEVDLVVPLQQPAEDTTQKSQEQLAALWEQQQSELQQETAQELSEEGSRLGASSRGEARFFRPAAQFQGVVPNCVFKLGELGLGYYLDEPPHATQEQQRCTDTEELQMLQQQQLRLQLQRREEELQRQRLLQEQEPRVKPISSSSGSSPSKAKATPEEPSLVFEPQAPYIGDGTEVAYTVRLDTTAGIIDIIVRPDWAPHGVRRFMEMVVAGELDDLHFYRAIEGCIAQFGLPVRRKWEPIPDDAPCGVPFLHGAVCFAALGENSRKSTLFICTGDMSHCLGQKPWETVIGAIAETSLSALERIDCSYGDIMEFGGNGPDTGRIAAEGNSYLNAHFPRLTHIRKAWPLDWEPENPQDDLSAHQSPKQKSELPKDPVALAASAAREAQEEAIRAARLAAIATTPEQADAAAEAARNAALFAQKAQQAAATAHAQVEAARTRMSQQQSQQQSQSPVLASSSGSRTTTPVPQRPSRASSVTPGQRHTPGLIPVPITAYNTVHPQASSVNCQSSPTVTSYTPQPPQANQSQSYTPMPRRSVSPSSGRGIHNSYTPNGAGNGGMMARGMQANQQSQGSLERSSAFLNTSIQVETSPAKTPLAQQQGLTTLPLSISSLPGRPDGLLGSSSPVCRQQSVQRNLPQTCWNAAQPQWQAQPTQPIVSSPMLPTALQTAPQQIPWVQQPQQPLASLQQPMPHLAQGPSSHNASARFTAENASIRFAPGGSVQSMLGAATPQQTNFKLQQPFAFNPALGGMAQMPMLGAIGR